MKNVKSIITLVPCFGLHKDAVLTRDNNSDDFVYSTEYAGNDHRQSTYITLSESLVDKEHFSAIEWFKEKPLTNKEQIKLLTEERNAMGDYISKLQSKLSEAEYALERTEKYLEETGKSDYNLIKERNEYLTKEMIDLRSIVAKRANRIDELFNRYSKAAITLDKGLYRFPWLKDDKDFVEAVTVYDNMIKVLEYIKGE